LIAPLIAGGIFPILLDALTVTTHPSILTESLRTISIIISELAEDLIGDYEELRSSVSGQICNSQHVLAAFSQILIQDNASHYPEIGRNSDVYRYSDTQFTLTLQIIEGLCRNDGTKCQSALASAGILDLLASKLAAWIVDNQPEFASSDHQTLLQTLPPPKSSYPELTRAIAVIIRNSQYLCARLLYSRDLVAIFPVVPRFDANPEEHPLSEPYRGLPWRSWDVYLPRITPAPLKDLHSSSFPALVYETARIPFVDSVTPIFGTSAALDDANSDLLAWLATMTRQCKDLQLLCTLLLFSTLLRHTELNMRFERPLAFLAVPVLVRLIEAEGPDVPLRTMRNNFAPYLIPENILTNLILGSSSLQMAAYEADTIKTLCLQLRKLFDPISDPQSVMWSPSPSRKSSRHSVNNPRLLGPPVLSPRLSGIIHRRVALLSALSALCQKEDIARKEIIKNGIIQLSTDALTSYPERMISDETWPKLDNVDPKEGNPTSVLIATLAFLRAMSRSVHILRTSLIDGAIAKPVFALLRHKNMEVRITATDVVTNLILVFSPMREVRLSESFLPSY
jgi:armadillo repeat-containing protein 8